ncbi:cytidylyltransferase domain-containing protein [Nocardioides nitrophenolicus]|uniref:cytidylyltransferase domain-containing protein n=1 Tax=Nocardioides nitrophenolicus TaxID=60489 RepID=UPI001959C445|nr:glycosyltransferase family protein [Nocardioides nitrophenolicus]MBM7518708.1 spore coat polysaccharide biosynthesis protein SpsF [Nocardioides nitrophenolicus]
MKVGVVTQARMTSTRLPGKVLIEVGGRVLLDLHLGRLAGVGDVLVVATTTNQADDRVADLAAQRGVGVVRGSEHDVLGRYAVAARSYDLDAVVRVTSDCPLIDGHLVAEAVELFRAAGDPWLYLSNTVERTYPRGLDFEVFGAEALFDADTHATDPGHREHVTPYLRGNGSGRMRLRSMRRADDAANLRLTLDTADDLALIRALIEDHGGAAMSGDELVELLRRHPELAALNAHVEQREPGE